MCMILHQIYIDSQGFFIPKPKNLETRSPILLAICEKTVFYDDYFKTGFVTANIMETVKLVQGYTFHDSQYSSPHQINMLLEHTNTMINYVIIH